MDTINPFRIIHSYMQHNPVDCSKCEGPLTLRATDDEEPEPYFECFACNTSFTPGTMMMEVFKKDLRSRGYTL